jgi:hypothetical protein
MADPNIIKLLAPEQIPQPRVNDGPDVYKYTKDMYDFLRRLFQNLGLILANIGTDEIASELVVIKYIDITQAVQKTYISEEDWRGRTIRGWCSFFDKAMGSTPADANQGVWKQYFTAVNNAIITHRVGLNYSGADVLIGWVTVNTGFDGGNLQLFLDGNDGRLYVDSQSGGFGNQFQAELVIKGSRQNDVPDVTI